MSAERTRNDRRRRRRQTVRRRRSRKAWSSRAAAEAIVPGRYQRLDQSRQADRDLRDSEGDIVARSGRRPPPSEIESFLPRFVGAILQTPPTFSAIRIAGARAYDLAREGETFEIEPRPIHVYRLDP